MIETQTNIANPELLNELAQYPEVRLRIEGIEAGYHPNGESPNGTLSRAMEENEASAEEEFTEEYDWVLALETHPYRDQEHADVIRNLAVNGLFLAGETYDTDIEPNFLKHLSDTLRFFLPEILSDVDDVDIENLPPAHEFESFVLGRWPAQEPEVRTQTRSTRLIPDAASRLVGLGFTKRMEEYRAGLLTRREQSLWAAHFPEEVPVINGEFEWISLNLADLD